MSSDLFFDPKLMKKLDRKLQLTIDRVGVDRKTLDEVFDKSTLLALEKLISHKVIDILDFPISTGKEGNVFRGVTPDKTYVAVKIYRTSNLTFKHISEYIIGDPRFSSLPKNRRDVIFAWTQKEFKNLERLNRVGVSAPKPIAKIKNVLVMEYIGDEEQPAPLLKDVKLDDPESMFNKLIDFISVMYKEAKMVHSDMSAFNVLIHNEKPYLIDLGQGVLLGHPQSYEFLKRDIYNIVFYFKKFKINADEKQIYMKITNKEW